MHRKLISRFWSIRKALHTWIFCQSFCVALFSDNKYAMSTDTLPVMLLFALDVVVCACVHFEEQSKLRDMCTRKSFSARTRGTSVWVWQDETIFYLWNFIFWISKHNIYRKCDPKLTVRPFDYPEEAECTYTAHRTRCAWKMQREKSKNDAWSFPTWLLNMRMNSSFAHFTMHAFAYRFAHIILHVNNLVHSTWREWKKWRVPNGWKPIKKNLNFSHSHFNLAHVVTEWRRGLLIC